MPSPCPRSTQSTIETFVRSVEARDLDRLAECFALNATYQNVPHEPVIGQAAIRSIFEPILRRSERVELTILNAAYVTGRGHLERVDRFWIDGTCYAVPCHGVADVDESAGHITAFRDYLDLAVWRQTLGDVLTPPF